ncbi:MAG: peptidoglycan editing factor PgeF [Oscillospiraceae bacterium]|jgi:YfiH family protein|nr:peptidoglycan editing factor PgeF [Oscillospiraceae bacterium]
MTFVDDTNYNGLQYITADNIHSSDVIAIFSTRNGGVSGQTSETQHLCSMNLAHNFSPGEDDYENIIENYKIIMSSQGFDMKSLVTLQQKHTSNIIVVDDNIVKKYRNSPLGFCQISEAADAHITNIKGLLLSVRTADCVPVLLYDSKNQAIAAIHAGWRGALTGIIQKTIKCMIKEYNTNPKDIRAAIGPSIGICCFEVGFEVQESFVNEYGEYIKKHFTAQPESKPFCDIKSMSKAFLIESGVLEGNIEMSDLCTKCNPDLFFSYRYSGGKCGLMSSFIGLK